VARGYVDATPGPYAPPPLRIVQEFVNTADRRRGHDLLNSGRSLARWLEVHDLLGAGHPVGDDEVALAVGVREALRAVFDPRRAPGSAAAEVLSDIARRAGLVPYVNASGVVRLKPSAGGAVGGLGRIVAISMLALLDGSGSHLKACASPECRSLFFDGSRTRSTDRCEDPLCGGGRHRLRVLRARRS
jgi:predicted RNA-binding Zn ribbon-like protein